MCVALFLKCIFEPRTTELEPQKQGLRAYASYCEMWILYSRSKMCETEKSFQ